LINLDSDQKGYNKKNPSKHAIKVDHRKPAYWT